MPGGRLTHQDRQRIVSGLAEGLGYAEIARRLGRPTSTISREVARNSRAGGYRADHAQQATKRRVRRSKPTPPRETPVDAYGRDPEAVHGFVEEFAVLMVQTGLPKMAARVLVSLFITDAGSLTAAELVQRLGVSPASVSKAIGYLEGLDLVRRERDPRRGRERYVIDDDVWIRTWSTSARTHAMWADAAQRGVELFNAATPAGARLDHMGQFFAQLSDDMSGGPTISLDAGDALTVLAALVHTGAFLTVDQLATALGWHPDRVSTALHAAGPDRLTPAQREGLTNVRGQIRE